MTLSAAAASETRRPSVVIRPQVGWRSVNFADLWQYRELVYFLAWRDLKVRYRRATIGILLAVLQPLLATTLFAVVFGRLARIPSDGLPYPLFAFLGLLPWTYFSRATSSASGSLVANRNLISKVYFPRLVIPIAGTVGSLVDLAIGTVVVLVLLPFFGVVPGPTIVFLPLLAALACLTALSVGIWLSALDVQYHDVRYAIPFFMQMWMFATPVVYPASLVPEDWRWLYGLNPMAGVVEGFRWALVGHREPPGPMLLVSLAVVLVVLTAGVFYFRRMERTFADVI